MWSHSDVFFLCFCLSVSDFVSFCPLSVSLFMFLCLSLSVSVSFSLCLSVLVCLSVYLCLSVSLSVPPPSLSLSLFLPLSVLWMEPGKHCGAEPQLQPRFLIENDHPGIVWKEGYEKRDWKKLMPFTPVCAFALAVPAFFTCLFLQSPEDPKSSPLPRAATFQRTFLSSPGSRAQAFSAPLTFGPRGDCLNFLLPQLKLAGLWTHIQVVRKERRKGGLIWLLQWPEGPQDLGIEHTSVWDLLLPYIFSRRWDFCFCSVFTMASFKHKHGRRDKEPLCIRDSAF